MCIYKYIYKYRYIYIERERDWEIYIYIYIHIVLYIYTGVFMKDLNLIFEDWRNFVDNEVITEDVEKLKQELTTLQNKNQTLNLQLKKILAKKKFYLKIIFGIF